MRRESISRVTFYRVTLSDPAWPLFRPPRVRLSLHSDNTLYTTHHHSGANQPQHDPSSSNNPPSPEHLRHRGGIASSTSIFVTGGVRSASWDTLRSVLNVVGIWRSSATQQMFPQLCLRFPPPAMYQLWPEEMGLDWPHIRTKCQSVWTTLLRRASTLQIRSSMTSGRRRHDPWSPIRTMLVYDVIVIGFLDSCLVSSYWKIKCSFSERNGTTFPSILCEMPELENMTVAQVAY